MQKAFFKGLKSELVYHQDFRTQIMAKLAIFEYIQIRGSTRRYNRLRSFQRCTTLLAARQQPDQAHSTGD